MPLIIVIIVVALVIASIVTIGRMIFGGNASKDTQKTPETTVVDSVLNQDGARSVRWTVRGPIVADEKYRSYQITVSPTKRSFVSYSGYLEQVLDSKTYENNAKAYEEFTYALRNAEVGKANKADDEDFRGVCATNGIAYKFETLNGGSADHTLWSSTCEGSKGTLAADPLKIHALFVNQIPDFEPMFNKVF